MVLFNLYDDWLKNISSYTVSSHFVVYSSVVVILILHIHMFCDERIDEIV